MYYCCLTHSHLTLSSLESMGYSYNMRQCPISHPQCPITFLILWFAAQSANTVLQLPIFTLRALSIYIYTTLYLTYLGLKMIECSHTESTRPCSREAFHKPTNVVATKVISQSQTYCPFNSLITSANFYLNHIILQHSVVPNKISD